METRFYKLNLDHGVLDLSMPEAVSKDDVQDVEDLLSLIVKQIRRRAESCISDEEEK